MEKNYRRTQIDPRPNTRTVRGTELYRAQKLRAARVAKESHNDPKLSDGGDETRADCHRDGPPPQGALQRMVGASLQGV